MSQGCIKTFLVLFVVQSYESACGPVREISCMVHSNGSVVWFSHLFNIESILTCVVQMSHSSVLP